MKKAVYVSLFSAFICVGAFIQIPLPLGVPVVIQDMMAILAGFLLGPIFGSLSVLSSDAPHFQTDPVYTAELLPFLLLPRYS